MPIDASADPPERPALTGRAAEIVATARRVLDADGPDALTMRRIGDELGMKAPSLYKHFASKAAIEGVLIETGFEDIGRTLRRAIDGLSPGAAVEPLLQDYRRIALEQPNLYRLATIGPLDRASLTPGLEDWSGEPFLLVMGEPHLAQAVWSAAHGMVSLELDGRYPPDSDLDRLWAAAASAFSAALRPARGRR